MLDRRPVKAPLKSGELAAKQTEGLAKKHRRVPFSIDIYRNLWDFIAFLFERWCEERNQ